MKYEGVLHQEYAFNEQKKLERRGLWVRGFPLSASFNRHLWSEARLHIINALTNGLTLHSNY